MIDKVRLAALSGGHLVDDIYQGAVPALVALLVVERRSPDPGSASPEWATATR